MKTEKCSPSSCLFFLASQRGRVEGRREERGGGRGTGEGGGGRCGSVTSQFFSEPRDLFVPRVVADHDFGNTSTGRVPDTSHEAGSSRVSLLLLAPLGERGGRVLTFPLLCLPFLHSTAERPGDP